MKNYRFLIWTGAKAKVMKKLKVFLPKKITGSYYEPFLGSASVFFYLIQNQVISNDSKIYLSDINTYLIATYLGVRNSVSEVILYLKNHINAHSKEYFYKLKEERYTNLSEIAAQFIYLNRTTYGGCYRENSEGGLSLTFRTEDPVWVDEMSMYIASGFLQRADIIFCDYSRIIEKVQSGDFVYLDSPYSSFNKSDMNSLYNAGGFGQHQQEKLRDFCIELDRKGVYFCQSNSLDEWVWDNYEQFRINQFPVKYKTTKESKKGKKTYEAVITNYDPDLDLLAKYQ